MGLLVFSILTATAVAAPHYDVPAEKEFRAAQIHMGVSFKIILYAPDQATANRGFKAAFARIEQLNRVMSDYDPTSEVSRLSHASPTSAAVIVSNDLFGVLQHAHRLSQQTGGAFDVTVGPLTKLWRRARRQQKMPSPQRLEEARSAVGYKNLVLHPHQHSVELLRPNMKLDLGGIAKGYAADQALIELQAHGIPRAAVNGSGDIALGEPPPGLKGWKIGVALQGPQALPSLYLTLCNCAIATSGDAWQYVEIDGKRYSHILNPQTGMGLTDRSGVSIVAKNCITADSLASAVSVLGPEKGMKLVEQTPHASAIIVRIKDGKTELFQSSGMKCHQQISNNTSKNPCP